MKTLKSLILTALALVTLTGVARADYWTGLRWDTGATAPTACYEPGIFYQTSGTVQFYWCNLATHSYVNIPTSASPTFTGTVTYPSGQTLTTPTITNPTVTTGTFATPALNNPVVVGPAPVACTATCSPTAGMLSVCLTSTGCTFTIPAATGTGNVIRMQILTTNAASGGEKVLLTTVTDTIIGTAIGENSGTAKIFVGNAGTYHSIQMPLAGSQPQGGFAGDTITCTDVASTVWSCDMKYQAGTTPTTPYSTATT